MRGRERSGTGNTDTCMEPEYDEGSRWLGPAQPHSEQHTLATEPKRNPKPYLGLWKNLKVCPTHTPQQHSSNTPVAPTSCFWNHPAAQRQ